MLLLWVGDYRFICGGIEQLAALIRCVYEGKELKYMSDCISHQQTRI